MSCRRRLFGVFLTKNTTHLSSLVLACAFTFFGQVRAVSAQSWTRPPLRDYDAPAEEHSSLWGQVLAGGNADYDSLLSSAITLSASGDKEHQDQALALLKQAVAHHPQRPRAYSLIGKYHQSQRNWAACGESLAHVFSLDPAFAEEDLRLRLGTCVLYAGRFEEATKHFQHLITQGLETSLVQLRLGEGLMALGHLDDALFALRRAVKLARRSRLREEALYALAIALDRSERIQEAREILRTVGSRKLSRGVLTSANKVFVPAVDEHYYLGLVHQAQRNDLRALYHFRHFLALAPNSPWKRHASSHMEALGRPKMAARLETSGSAQWPAEALRNAIQKRASALGQCLGGKPDVLASITLSAALTRPPSKFTAKAVLLTESTLDEEHEANVLRCLESAARTIAMPKQSGPIGGHGSAQFEVLGSPSS